MNRWSVGQKAGDPLRRLRCRLTGHAWQVNSRGTQRMCPRCWTVEDWGWDDITSCAEALDWVRRPSEDCGHQWLDRPESDTIECLVCGCER